MKYLILSDIHANLEALEAILDDPPTDEVPDRILVLGDLVGYGPDPAPVVKRVREMPNSLVIRGNHDKVVAGIETGRGFNDMALDSAAWSRGVLGKEEMDYLGRLPAGPQDLDNGEIIVHGSPRDEDEYVFNLAGALMAFESVDAPLILCGHTHQPFLVVLDDRGVSPMSLGGERSDIDLNSGARYLFNPGSVGQPRDGDPRTSFGFYDSAAHRITHIRKPYDMETTGRKIEAAGLPPFLSRRLISGI